MTPKARIETIEQRLSRLLAIAKIAPCCAKDHSIIIDELYDPATESSVIAVFDPLSSNPDQVTFFDRDGYGWYDDPERLKVVHDD